MANERSEAASLARLLQVSLSPPPTSSGLLHLPDLAKELAAERACKSDAAPSESRPFTADVAERALVARLGALSSSSPSSSSAAAGGYDSALHCCASVYGRADAEARRLPPPPPPLSQEAAEADPASKAKEEWRSALEGLKALCLTYSGLAVFFDAFPSSSSSSSSASNSSSNPSAPPRSNALLLLDMMDAAVAASAGGLAGIAAARLPHGARGGAPLAPPGFVDAFAARWADEQPEALTDFFSAATRECGSRLRRAASPLGEWQPAMRHLLEFASSPAAAAALVRSPRWLPLPLVDGAALEKNSLLGPAFSVSIVFSPRGREEYNDEDDDDGEFEDEGPSTWPPEMQSSVGAIAAWVESGDYEIGSIENGDGSGGNVSLSFSSPTSSSSSPSSVAAAAASDSLLRAQSDVRGALRSVVMTLLRSKGLNVRDRTMAWLCAAVNANRERGKLSPDPRRASTPGFALNVEAALLDACAPFADPRHRERRAWGKVRARALADGKVDWAGDTRLALDEAGARAWSRAVREAHRAKMMAREQQKKQQEGDGKGDYVPYSYHFVCDAFWAAAKATSYGSASVSSQAATLRARAAHTDDVARQLDGVAAAVASGAPLPAGAPPIPPGGNPAAAARRFAAQAEQHRAIAASMRVYSRVLDLAAAVPLLASGGACPSSGSGGSSSGSSGVDFVGLVAAWAMRLAMLGDRAEEEAEAAEDGDATTTATAATTATTATPTPTPELTIPLPTPPSESFKALPEEIFNSMSWSIRNAPEDVLLSGSGASGSGNGGNGGNGTSGNGNGVVGDVLRCVVALVASPEHVRNPYVRAQLFSLLHSWVVERGPRVFRRGGGAAPAAAAEATSEVRVAATRLHALVLSTLDADALLSRNTVRSTLALYSDIEDTSRNVAFQEKFELRLRASQVLKALWDSGSSVQRGAWLAAADEATRAASSSSSSSSSSSASAVGGGGGGGTVSSADAEVMKTTYGRFMHFLLTDAIYLLDQALEKLKLIAAHEKATAGAGAGGGAAGGAAAGGGAFGGGSVNGNNNGNGNGNNNNNGGSSAPSDHEVAEASRFVPAALELSAACLDTVRYSTREPRGAAPWLTRAMRARTAEALNYFLAALVGPARKGLKVKDPRRLRWDPKALLVSLSTVYINLAAADSVSASSSSSSSPSPSSSRPSPFAAAVAADARSFSRRLFPDALQVLRGLSLLPQSSLEQLERFASSADAAADAADREKEATASAPDEFVDPLTSELMADPVRLPASGAVVDASTLARSLLSKAVDPFSNTPLTMEEVVPEVELARRIREWKEGLGLLSASQQQQAKEEEEK